MPKESISTYTFGDELAHFTQLWEERSRPPTSHSQEEWDERAKEWIAGLGAEGTDKESSNARVRATAEYLRSAGLLQPDSTAADVGCGPGLFVSEFARHIKYALGIDQSRVFAEYAREIFKKRGLTNAAYDVHDFIALDLADTDYTGAFDLVFTSITPAASGKGCLEKLIAMSRAHCYNASFVQATDSVAERVARDVFGEPFRSRFDGSGFYAMANVLWLNGYYPVTSYYDDERDEKFTPDADFAANIADTLGKFADGDAEKILRYIEKYDGERHTEYRFGGLLWDVRTRGRR
ncbi:MAG: class I SAM-dependent methyltransferase [Oscillospiraceae bacterium]|jgi:hypothetical protein|nr:class I SAM-dependent methyltransferase [Oscillospiraceae bacterium]